MIYIVLHKIIDHDVMSPKESKIDTTRISIPVTIIGPMEETNNGTLIYLSNNFGQVKVNESIDDIMEKMTTITKALAVQGR